MAIVEQDVNAAPDAPSPEPDGSAPPTNKGDLLLDSLEITNFRAFRHLVVPRLGRVNLITGKNGVGKSSLLEALYVYASAGDPQVVREVLLNRQELFSGNPIPSSTVSAVNLEALFHVFSRKLLAQSWSVNAISPDDGFLTPRLSFELRNETDAGAREETVQIYSDLVEYNYSAVLLRDGSFRPGQQSARNEYGFPSAFLRAGIPSGNVLAAQWDEIVLTSAEDTVLHILHLLNQEIQRVSFVSEMNSPLGRVAMVKSSAFKSPVSMARFGEGVMRAFAIALSLTKSEQGLLLVDEIENGLHYSVLPEVWRLIFQTARRLNVQVFATTHSWDCIEAFQMAAAEDEESEGVLVRLLNKDGNVLSTVFDERRLAFVTRDGIEVR